MIDTVIRFLALGVLSAWCAVLIRPFIALVLWGTIVAVVLYPLFLWLGKLLGGRKGLAATLISLVGIGVIVGPVSIIVTAAAGSIREFADDLADGNLKVPPPPPNIADWPIAGEPLSRLWEQASVNLAATISQYKEELNAIIGKLLALAGSTGLGLLQFLVAIIIAAGLMLNAETIERGIRRFILRLNPDRGEGFMTLAVATIRNVTRGVIGIAVVQGLWLGLGFFAAGIPLAGILTVACLILTIVQIGPGLIVLPSIIYAWSALNPIVAAIYTVFMFAGTLVDNLLKPMLMAAGLPVPMLVIFIGVIGGTLAHGIVGLFVGPVVLALGYELLAAWVNNDVDEQVAELGGAVEPEGGQA